MTLWQASSHLMRWRRRTLWGGQKTTLRFLMKQNVSQSCEVHGKTFLTRYNHNHGTKTIGDAYNQIKKILLKFFWVRNGESDVFAHDLVSWVASHYMQFLDIVGVVLCVRLFECLPYYIENVYQFIITFYWIKISEISISIIQIFNKLETSSIS